MPQLGAARLLIVDDDPELRHFLRTELELEGYACTEAATGQQALMQVWDGRGDLLLLDWTLPDFSGVELCRRLRGTDDGTQVLMLTDRDDVKERVEALDAGADDYLTKPFSIEELLARVRARLRRNGAENGAEGEAPQPLRLGGQPVALTGKEFELLLLIRQPQQVHSRSAILDAVWGAHWVGDDSVLDVYVGKEGALIQTVRGVGFMLKEGPAKPT